MSEGISVDLKTIIVSAIVAIITSAITAYITTRFRMREEKAKWNREFAIKYAEAQVTDNARAQRMATQIGIGVLIFEDPETSERQRVFVPPNCRLVVGKAPQSDIPVKEPMMSKQHFAIVADEAKVYVEELGSPNGVFLNGELVKGSRRLKTGDVIHVGETKFSFHELDKR
jgi:pSer/pThr/pTyr-binding forkhead associated (FHA) protein